MKYSHIIVFSALFVFLRADDFKRVCCFTNWAQYRPVGGEFLPSDIDPTLCSHINFAFVGIANNSLVPTQASDDGPTGLYAQVINLKAAQTSLKVLLSVGGGGFNLTLMTQMFSSSKTRQQFIQNSIAFLRQRNFDGLDLDFEFPGQHPSPPKDKQRYTLFVQECQAAFHEEAQSSGKPRLLLTAAVASDKADIDGAYEISKVAAALDFINLMAYDFHGSWDAYTGFNAPLYNRSTDTPPDNQYNVDWAVKYWIAGGCTSNKLVVGLASYGRSFQLASAADHGVGDAATGPGPAGPFTGDAGVLAYYEICDIITQAGSTVVYDTAQKVPYVYSGTEWVGYDNVQSLTNKVQYIRQGGYGGWMMWTVDLDDFSGAHCNASKYPLLTAINAH